MFAEKQANRDYRYAHGFEMKRKLQSKPPLLADPILPITNGQSPKCSDRLDRAPGTRAARGAFEKAYREMAADESREADAEVWIEASLGDISDEPFFADATKNLSSSSTESTFHAEALKA